MAKNIVYEPADRMSVIVTHPAVPASGDPVRFGVLTGIALENELATGYTSCFFGKCVAQMSVKAIDDSGNSPVALGDTICYTDGDTPPLSKKTSGAFFGFAMATVNTGATATIDVYKVPTPGSGTLGSGTVGATQLASSAVTPVKLAAVAANKMTSVTLGAISATGTYCAFIAPTDCTLVACQIVTKDAIAANDTNYWTILLQNRGAGGSGTDTIVTKNTKITGGVGFVAYDAWDMGALSGTYKEMVAGDVAILTFTKSASAVAFAEALAIISYVTK